MATGSMVHYFFLLVFRAFTVASVEWRIQIGLPASQTLTSQPTMPKPTC